MLPTSCAILAASRPIAASLSPESRAGAFAIRSARDLNISSTLVVAYNLKAPEGKGLLKHQSKVSRGIRIPQTTLVRINARQFTQVPLLGVITAGQPLPDPEDTSSESAEMIEVPPDIAPSEKLKDVYALQTCGRSMIDARHYNHIAPAELELSSCMFAAIEVKSAPVRSPSTLLNQPAPYGFA